MIPLLPSLSCIEELQSTNLQFTSGLLKRTFDLCCILASQSQLLDQCSQPIRVNLAHDKLCIAQDQVNLCCRCISTIRKVIDVLHTPLHHTFVLLDRILRRLLRFLAVRLLSLLSLLRFLLLSLLFLLSLLLLLSLSLRSGFLLQFLLVLVLIPFLAEFL